MYILFAVTFDTYGLAIDNEDIYKLSFSNAGEHQPIPSNIGPVTAISL